MAIVILAGFSRRSDLRMDIHWGYPKKSSFLMLVDGLEHEWIMTFHVYIYIYYIGNVMIPTDFHIFQRGRYTTNQ